MVTFRELTLRQIKSTVALQGERQGDTMSCLIIVACRQSLVDPASVGFFSVSRNVRVGIGSTSDWNIDSAMASNYAVTHWEAKRNGGAV